MISSARRRTTGRECGGPSRRAFVVAALLCVVATPKRAGAGPATESAETAAALEAVGARANGRRIARTALKHEGARYTPGGNTPRGFDCSGFTQFVIEKTLRIDVGQSVPPQWRFGKRVAKGKWRAGDLVFFENTFQRGLSHVGIYLEHGRFIHAENEQTGVVISQIDSDYYASHYHGARRLT